MGIISPLTHSSTGGGDASESERPCTPKVGNWRRSIQNNNKRWRRRQRHPLLSRCPRRPMRPTQSLDVPKHESMWIYLLHHHAPRPPTRLLTDASVIRSPVATVSEARPDRAVCREPPPSARPRPTPGRLVPPASFTASAMMLSNQDKTRTNLLILSLPRVTELSQPRHATSEASPPPPLGPPNKRPCFPKKCDFPLCTNSSRSRGFCYSHGGGRRCRVDGCHNGAVSRDLCKRHGGGRRCRISGCKSSSESGGLCYSHGGGRRCSLAWCSARAKKGGFCVFHLTGDRTPPSSAEDVALSRAAAAAADASVHPNVVETLLSLAKDQSNVKGEHRTSSSVSPASSGKSAYAIATLLN